MKPNRPTTRVYGGLTGIIVASALTLTGLRLQAATNVPAIAYTSNPSALLWRVGDYWVIKDVQVNRLGREPETMAAMQSLFCVVAQTNIGRISCFIVEKWPDPINPVFPLQHTVYYFRAADLGVVRRVDWYYLQGALCGPATKNYRAQTGTPHVEADGMWFPSFSSQVVASNAEVQSNRNERGQIVTQMQAPFSGNSLAGPTLPTATPNDALVAAARGQTGVVINLIEGVGAGRTALRRQTWMPGLPWFLHEELVIDNVTVGESWLVEYGQAQPSNNINPFDAPDMSPLVETNASVSTVAAASANVISNVPLTESYTAPVEPWAGCYWPFYDTAGNANLYDYDSGDPCCAMITYDNYFTPGRTPAWSWEYANHRTTDPSQWWWGHCDGWAASSIMEPDKPMTTCGPFTAEEQQGLFAECWNTFDKAYFYPNGANVNDNIPMTPGEFWQALRDNIRGDNNGGISRPVGFDLYSCPASVSGRDEVWNYPVFSYSVTYAITANSTYSGTFHISYEDDNSAPIPTEHASGSVTYTFSGVVITAAGVVNPNSGTWTSSTWTADPNGDGTSNYVYPDVAWYPTTPVGENPYVNYLNVRGMTRVAAPSNLSASPASSHISLSWTDNSSNESGFRIESKSDSTGAWTQIATVGANVTSCSVPASSSSHTYRVRAYSSSAGNSLYSNEASVSSNSSGSISIATTPLTINSAEITGVISSAGDAEWYSFTVSATGTYIIFAGEGSLSDYNVYLYGPNSSTNLRQEDSAQIVQTLKAGKYYVKVSASDANATGSYTIGVFKPATLAVNGAKVTGTISPAGDADWYSFTASSVGEYTITTTSGTLADNYMYLYGPNSLTSLLQEDDDNGTNLAAQIMQTLDAGKYYVKVRASDNNATGTYTIRVIQAPPPVTLKMNGAPITGTISYAGDDNWFAFTATSAGEYTINTTSGTLADNYMYLYGPNSKTALLQEDDDNGTSFAAQIVQTLAPGKYYVKIRAFDANARGTYKIHVLKAPSPVTLKVGGAASTGSISSPGDVDWYAFTVSTAGTYTVSTKTGTLDNDYLSLYGPNNQTTLLQDDDQAQIVQALAAGKYYVKVRAFDVNATGKYTIRVTQ